MSEAYIPNALRQRVAAQARHRCGYCLTSEAIVGTPMERPITSSRSRSAVRRRKRTYGWLAHCAMITKVTGSLLLTRSPVLLCAYLTHAIKYGASTLPGQPRGIGSLV
jgi:ribosomal protein L34E